MRRKCSGKNIFSPSRRVSVALPRITNAPLAVGLTGREGCLRVAPVTAFRNTAVGSAARQWLSFGHLSARARGRLSIFLAEEPHFG